MCVRKEGSSILSDIFNVLAGPLDPDMSDDESDSSSDSEDDVIDANDDDANAVIPDEIIGVVPPNIMAAVQVRVEKRTWGGALFFYWPPPTSWARVSVRGSRPRPPPG